MISRRTKRGLDLMVAGVLLVVTAPALAVACVAIWLQDWGSPFYVAPRVGVGGKEFQMIKLRSMVLDADRSGVSSTSAMDPRVTGVGAIVRRWKVDELPQLWNVLRGEMSMVGPRPNVRSEIDLYTTVERRLLEVLPGITDLASIVFADEGEILRGVDDSDVTYRQLIRPYKSRLGLLYVSSQNVWLDARLLMLTVRAIVDRQGALEQVARLVQHLGGDAELISVSLRRAPLVPTVATGTDPR